MNGRFAVFAFAAFVACESEYPADVPPAAQSGGDTVATPSPAPADAPTPAATTGNGAAAGTPAAVPAEPAAPAVKAEKRFVEVNG
ncbi:MAG: hypothetical protein H7Z43_03485, partial [Clostridia bacterium]|nr:hypothetical protein [Deltaproteobacteria bacterium]